MCDFLAWISFYVIYFQTYSIYAEPNKLFGARHILNNHNNANTLHTGGARPRHTVWKQLFNSSLYN